VTRDPDEYVPPELEAGWAGNRPHDEYDPVMDRDYPPTREEPDCGGCNDSGQELIIRPGHAARYRRCRSCDPTRRDRVWARLRRLVRSFRAGWRSGRRSGDGFDDEPPF
jgi:hypothetical protein